jgi:hypothetical protein
MNSSQKRKPVKRASAKKKTAKAKRSKRSRLVKRRVVSVLNLVLVGSRAIDEFHREIDKAMDKAYERKGPIEVFNRKEGVENVMAVVRKYSNKKRGRPFETDITKATEIFRDELKKSRLTFTKFIKRKPSEREKFWNERIWATRQSEIISPERLGQLMKDQTWKRLIDERRRIEDRVRREMIKEPGKGKERSNFNKTK